MSQLLSPGVHDIAADRYHADDLTTVPSLSRSVAALVLNQSPLHGWTAHPRLNPDYEPTNRKTFDIGRAAHRAVLGQGGDYVAYPTDLLASNGAASTKEAKAWADAVRAEGMVPLKADEVDEVGSMAETVRRQLAAMGIVLDPSRSELTALAEVDGVMCRAMIDNAPVDPRQPIYDFKTTEDASADAVIRSVTNYAYDLQAAFYLDTWKAATGEDRRFRFIFCEKSAPYGVSVVELFRAPIDATLGSPDEQADWMVDAHGKAREARRIWGECLAANIWPGYPAQVALIGAPSYHRQKWADRSVGNPVISKELLRKAAAFQSPKGMTQ